MPRSGGPPVHPDVGKPRPCCGLPRTVLPARVVHSFALPPAPWVPPWGAAVWPPGAHPGTLLGQSPPGLGVRQEEMKPKLSC